MSGLCLCPSGYALLSYVLYYYYLPTIFTKLVFNRYLPSKPLNFLSIDWQPIRDNNYIACAFNVTSNVYILRIQARLKKSHTVLVLFIITHIISSFFDEPGETYHGNPASRQQAGYCDSYGATNFFDPVTA